MKKQIVSCTMSGRRPVRIIAASATFIIVAEINTLGAAPPAISMPFSTVDGQHWTITTGYGGSENHRGDDYYALDFNMSGSSDYGKPILAAAPGSFLHADWSDPINGTTVGYGLYGVRLVPAIHPPTSLPMQNPSSSVGSECRGPCQSGWIAHRLRQGDTRLRLRPS